MEFLGGYSPGFRGSVAFKPPYYDGLVHAVSRRDHHLTVCGAEIDRRDDYRMCTNNNMETVNCLRCWMSRDPFP
jgi:hypothetical protein